MAPRRPDQSGRPSDWPKDCHWPEGFRPGDPVPAAWQPLVQALRAAKAKGYGKSKSRPA